MLLISIRRKYGGHCWRNVGRYEYKLGSVLLGQLGEEEGSERDSSDEILEEAEEHLSCAVGVLCRTHGEDHHLVSKVLGMLGQARERKAARLLS